MPRVASKGQCSFCGRLLSRPGMTRHLATCPKRPDEVGPATARRAKPTRVFHLVVSTRYSSPYWLQIEATADATLEDVDAQLRDTWLECCGHLSAFRLGDRSFSSSGGWDEDEPTTIKLGKLLMPGQKLDYEYDFGSTTELTIAVAGERTGRPPERVAILARNEPPEISCDACEDAATRVCSQCVWHDTGWLCDRCAKGHKCGEEMLLPVVNSPRTGVCGYDGPYQP
jgi:hypothetical protein